MKFVEEQRHRDLSGIYKIQQVSTGLIYIGQTKTRLIKRYWHHTWKLNKNTHDNKYLQNSWNKYGAEDFLFEIVHVLNKDEDMNDLEIQYIKDHDSFTNGFNMTTGGEGKRNCPTSDYAKKITGEKNRIHNLGKKASDETKARMSESQKGRIMTDDNKEKLRASRLGVKWSEEHKKMLSESHIGSKNAVSVINEDIATIIKQKLIKNYSVNDIATELSVNHRIIRSIQRSKVWNHVEVEGWEDYVIVYNKSKQKLLTDDEVRNIRKLLLQDMTVDQISKVCSVGYQVVYGIKQNKTYKHVI